MPPVRCYTCGKCVCPQIERCRKLVGQGKPLNEALSLVGFPPENDCCRRIAMSCFVVEPTPKLPKNVAGYCEYLSSDTQSVRIVPSR
jgi:DNA-directed RNA polymerase subunit N (RpoN/RPB10)